MSSKDEITNILNAINEINTKTKKKNTITTVKKVSTPKLNQELVISPDVDRLIREAEDYKKIKNVQTNISQNQMRSKKHSESDVLILTNEIIENSVNTNFFNTKPFDKIRNLQETEKKLRLEIASLKKNKILLKKQDIHKLEPKESYNLVSDTKDTLKSIYKQVEEQKKIFLELKIYSAKIEKESSVFKENYEKLIIENNELKTRLKIAKEQIASYENNKNDLLDALDQLNEILSKNNIVGKISPKKTASVKPNLMKATKIETIE